MLLDTLMKAERDIYLKNSDSNKANGYYNRSLTTELKSDLLAIFIETYECEVKEEGRIRMRYRRYFL